MDVAIGARIQGNVGAFKARTPAPNQRAVRWQSPKSHAVFRDSSSDKMWNESQNGHPLSVLVNHSQSSSQREGRVLATGSWRPPSLSTGRLETRAQSCWVMALACVRYRGDLALADSLPLIAGASKTYLRQYTLLFRAYCPSLSFTYLDQFGCDLPSQGAANPRLLCSWTRLL